MTLPTLWKYLVAFAVLGALLPAQAQYSAGVGTASITPCIGSSCGTDTIDTGTDLVVTSGGNGAQVNAIHSPLLARALTVKLKGDSEPYQVFLTLDVLMLDAALTKGIKDGITKLNSKIEARHILINASHTHNAPSVVSLKRGPLNEPVPSEKYLKGVTVRAIAAAQASLANLQDATLEYRTGTSRIAAYRRDDGKAGQTVPSPQRLDTLTVRRPDGSVLAIMASTACHTVTMYDAAGVVSADFVGAMRDALEGLIVPTQPAQGKPTVLFLQGFAGDLNPVTRQLGVHADEAALQTGTTLADEIFRLHQAPGSVLSGPIASEITLASLPLSPSTTTWAHDGRTALEIGAQVVRIGSDPSLKSSWTLAAFAGEVVSEQRQAVRSRWPTARNLTLAGYSNDIPGYVPTRRMIESDRAACGWSPSSYEGCFSFCLRYLPVGNWQDEQFQANRGRLVDRFGDNARDPDVWVVGTLSAVNGVSPYHPSVQVQENLGSLSITPVGGVYGLHYNGVVSTHSHDFTGRLFGVRVVQAPSLPPDPLPAPAKPTAELVISVGRDSANLYRFNIQDGRLRADAIVNGVPTYTQLGSFDPAANRYLRIRHDAIRNLMLWESSPNAVLWATLTSRPRDLSFVLSAVRAEIIAGTYSPIASPRVAVVDDAILDTGYAAAQSSAFIETFDASVDESPRWNETVLSAGPTNAPLTDRVIVVAKGNGRLQISPRVNVAGLHYNGFSTRDAYNFVGRQAIFEVVVPPGPTGTEMLGSVVANGNNAYRFNVQAGVLRADIVLAGSASYFPLAPFNASSHRFLRIRHDAPSDWIHWEVSANGVTWSSLKSTPRTVDLAAVQFELVAGTWAPVAQPGAPTFGVFEYR